MEGTARRVAVFIGAGALLAALVGFTVWATSSPGKNNRAGFTAEAAGTTGASATSTTSSPTTATVTENQTHTRTVRSSASAADNGSGAGAGAAGHADSGRPGQQRVGAAMPTGYNAAHDPYLPPHAVVAPAPESGQPSRVFRPSNIVPSSARPMAAPQGTTPAAEPTPAGQTDARTPSQQTPGSTPPREPESSAAQTSTPDTPAPGGSEVQPQTTEAPDEASSESEQTPQPGNGSGPSHGPDDMDGTGGSNGIQVAEPSAAEAPDAQEAQTPDADAAEAPASPTRVAGKEDVAGYPQEKDGMTARDVFDKITGRETK